MKKGFALATVLWISAILMASTLYLLSMYKKSVNNAESLNNKLQAELLSDTYIDRLTFFALTGEFKENYITNTLKGFKAKIYINNKFQKIDDNISIKLKSCGEMLSVYGADISFLEHLMHYYTKEALNYKEPYLDWIDIDSNMHLNGAENLFYNQFQYTTSNRGIIQHPEELFLLKILNNRQSNKKIRY